MEHVLIAQLVHIAMEVVHQAAPFVALDILRHPAEAQLRRVVRYAMLVITDLVCLRCWMEE